MEQPEILVIDLSSQVASLIERTLRDLEHRSAVFGPDGTKKWLEKYKPHGIILSGGKQSVYELDALMPPKEILDLGVPIFGICFGMQWLAYVMGGKVVSNAEINRLDNKNYGEAQVKFSANDKVFGHLNNQEHVVWASHGDSVAIVPPGFKEAGWFTPAGTIAAMVNEERGVYATQFHTEVKQTPIGSEIL
jgi:GMP synthase (glutamine-hydrolysing)